MNNLQFLNNIISEIMEYENKKINFRKFIDKIEIYINAIESDDGLQNVLISMWDKLEIPYALAAERGLTQIPQEDVSKILLVINKMKIVLENKIKDYEEKLNPK